GWCTPSRSHARAMFPVTRSLMNFPEWIPTTATSSGKRRSISRSSGTMWMQLMQPYVQKSSTTTRPRRSASESRRPPVLIHSSSGWKSGARTAIVGPVEVERLGVAAHGGRVCKLRAALLPTAAGGADATLRTRLRPRLRPASLAWPMAPRTGAGGAGPPALRRGSVSPPRARGGRAAARVRPRPPAPPRRDRALRGWRVRQGRRRPPTPPPPERAAGARAPRGGGGADRGLPAGGALRRGVRPEHRSANPRARGSAPPPRPPALPARIRP